MEQHNTTSAEENGQPLGSTIAQILRFLGSCLLAVGAIAYLLEGWYAVSDVSRYLKFLGVTGLLSVVGIATAVYLRENRGARTFLCLAAAAIPVNFCQLGALLYSVMPFKQVPVDMSHYLLWEAASLPTVLGLCAFSLAILSGIAWFSFSVLGRQGRFPLFWGVMLLNSLLLVPLRSIEAVVALTGIAVFGAWWVSRTLARMYSFEYSLEGVFCRLLLFIPSGILLLRTAIIYNHSSVITGIIALYCGAVILAGCRLLDKKNDFLPFPEFLGAILLLRGLSLETALVIDALPFSAAEPIIYLTPVVTLYAEAISGFLRRNHSFFRAIVYVCSAFLLALIMLSNANIGYCCVGVVTALLGFAYNRRQASRSISIAALCTLIVAAFCFVRGYLSFFLDSWVAMSLVGALIVLLGSLFEKNIISLSHIGLSNKESNESNSDLE